MSINQLMMNHRWIGLTRETSTKNARRLECPNKSDRGLSAREWAGRYHSLRRLHARLHRRQVARCLVREGLGLGPSLQDLESHDNR
jgi:hypothetical protein